MVMVRLISVLMVSSLLLIACGSSQDELATAVLSGEGESCVQTAECEAGLECVESVCQGKADIQTCEPACAWLECGDGGCPDWPDACGTCNKGWDCDAGICIVGAIGLKWVSIPGGTFDMGCSPGDDDCDGYETPVHSVSLLPFLMLETEVTEEQYEAVKFENPSCSCCGGGGADNPVECVAWLEASSFCNSIEARLPTEAEWEYAARGGTETKYYCGDDPECLNGIGWHEENSEGMKHSVKQKGANPYGLYDMLGNAWEWTNDWYDESYYESSPSSNPRGPNSSYGRAVRGGAFDLGSEFLRVSNRDGVDPLLEYDSLGFRCVRPLE